MKGPRKISISYSCRTESLVSKDVMYNLFCFQMWKMFLFCGSFSICYWPQTQGCIPKLQSKGVSFHNIPKPLLILGEKKSVLQIA